MEDGSVSAPYVVVCEGSADRVFLTRLLQTRWGVTDLSVRCTHTPNNPGRCAGRSGLKDTLLALDAVRTTVPGSIRGIAIVFDSDEDAQARFKEITETIRQSKLGYPRPDNPLEIKKGNGSPSIGIALIPWIDRQGHLDELVFESLQVTHVDLVEPITQYQTATSHRIGAWKFGSLSKMRLRCLIAASHEPDPSISLSFLLESSACPVDFNHPCFDPLVNFLERFRKDA